MKEKKHIAFKSPMNSLLDLYVEQEGPAKSNYLKMYVSLHAIREKSIKIILQFFIYSYLPLWNGNDMNDV